MVCARVCCYADVLFWGMLCSKQGTHGVKNTFALKTFLLFAAK
jgi:hypothetical protein